MAQVRRLHGSVLVAALVQFSRAAAGGPLVAGAHLSATLPRLPCSVRVGSAHAAVPATVPGRGLPERHQHGMLARWLPLCNRCELAPCTTLAAGISSQDYHKNCLSCLQVLSSCLPSMRMVGAACVQAPAAAWSTFTLARSSSTQCLAAERTGWCPRHRLQVRREGGEGGGGGTAADGGFWGSLQSLRPWHARWKTRAPTFLLVVRVLQASR